MAEIAAPPINDKREILGWAMYDWANSAFSTTIGAVFLGPYLSALVEAAAKTEYLLKHGVEWTEASATPLVATFLGIPVAPDSFLPFMISFSVVFQAGFLPILGAIADYSHRRKQMMQLFALIGGLTTVTLFFVEGNLWWLGGILYVIANLAFGAAIVFYNAYLPDIASADQRDRVSSFGWAMGYLGGGLLLIVNIALFLLSDSLGISSGLAVRINLASAGLWWLGWSVWTWRTLRSRHAARAMPEGENLLGVAFKQLSETMGAPPRLIAGLLLSPLAIFIWAPLIAPVVLYLLTALGLPTELAIMPIFLPMFGPIIMLVIFLRRKSRHLPETVKFLTAYLIYNDGIQTVIGVAATFAAAKIIRGGIEMPTVRLTLLILMIQFVAFGGALFFGWLAARITAKRALVVSILIWAVTVVYAYVGMRNTNVALELPSALGGVMLQQEAEFWVLGAFIALVLGGSQALSRSLFAQMVPKNQEAEFFSIYEISERGTSWLGPFIFAAVNQVVGNLRPAILSVVIFFLGGLAILVLVNVTKAMTESGREPIPVPAAGAAD